MYFGFRDVYVDYGKKEVLRGLSLDIPRGKVVTLIGQNGCGKSTLLKTVPKAVVPRGGEVLYLDKKLSSYPPKQLAQKIAYLSQVHESPPDIDVRTLVSYGRFPYSLRSRHDGGRRSDNRPRAIADGADSSRRPHSFHAFGRRAPARMDCHDYSAGAGDSDTRRTYGRT